MKELFDEFAVSDFQLPIGARAKRNRHRIYTAERSLREQNTLSPTKFLRIALRLNKVRALSQSAVLSRLQNKSSFWLRRPAALGGDLIV